MADLAKARRKDGPSSWTRALWQTISSAIVSYRSNPRAAFWALFHPTFSCSCVVLACAVSTAISLWEIAHTYHTVLFGDQWDTVPLFDHYLKGQVTWRELLAQHNEHRIFFPRLVFLLDLILDDARNTVNFVFNGLIAVLQTLLFVRLVNLSVAPPPLRFALYATAALLFFSVVQYDNFIWGFQVQFGGVFLFCTTSAYLLSVAQTKAMGAEPSHPWPVTALTAGLLIGLSATLMMSNGAVLLICILFVFLAARLFNRMTVIIAIAGLVAAVAFGATFTPHAGHTTLGYSLSHPLALAEHFCVYVGSIFFPIGLRWAVTFGIIGIAVYTVQIGALFFGRMRRDIPTLTLLAAMTFVLASGLLTASGRSSFGPEQAASNRYATPSALFWASAIVLLAAALHRAFSRQWGPRPLPVTLSLAALTALLVTSFGMEQKRFFPEIERRAHDAARARDAMLASVDDEDALRRLYPVPAHIKPIIETLKTHRLSTFADVRYAYGSTVPAADIAAGEDHCTQRTRGGIGRVAPVANLQDSFTVEGWSFDQEAGHSFPALLFLSDDRVVRGFASSTVTRSDVPLTLSRSQRHHVGWFGYARAGNGTPLTAYGIIPGNGRLCRIDAFALPVRNAGRVGQPFASLAFLHGQ